MLKLRRIAFVMAILVLGVSIAGCSTNSANKPKEPDSEIIQGQEPNENELYMVKDDFNREVKLEKAPERIISLAPSNTEILYAIGLGDKVVGVTINDDYPAEVLQVEKIGDYNGINLERVIELQPDLIINYGPGNEEENARLDEVGIKYVGFEPESIDAVLDTITRIGNITGAVEKAKTLTDEMNEKKIEILSKVEGSETKKVFYEIWHEPLMAAGSGSFLDELMKLCGGENVAKDAEGDYPQFDLEQLVERNPEVYLTSADIPEKTVESIMARPGFENIDAIKNGNVYVLDGNVVSRPGPRIIEALELIARAIHPEKF